MARATLRVFAFCLLTLDCAAAPAAAQSLSTDEMAAFLKTAKVIKSTQTKKGVTQPYRLTLTNGTLTHDASFQSIDQKKPVQEFQGSRKPEMAFVDSWRFNVAAWRLAGILGLAHMMPVTVERRWDNKDGAISWWVDEVMMDDGERRKAEAEPPDKDAWNQQNHRMRVFAQLVQDTDRNTGNILITKDWRLVMIDFTRAFRVWDLEPPALNSLRRCDRSLLAALRDLKEPEVKKAVGHYLMDWEARAVMRRRDQIVMHFEALVGKLGEQAVLY